MNFKTSEVYVQSVGLAKEHDYCWVKVTQEGQHIREIPTILQQARDQDKGRLTDQYETNPLQSVFRFGKIISTGFDILKDLPDDKQQELILIVEFLRQCKTEPLTEKEQTIMKDYQQLINKIKEF